MMMFLMIMIMIIVIVVNAQRNYKGNDYRRQNLIAISPSLHFVSPVWFDQRRCVLHYVLETGKSACFFFISRLRIEPQSNPLKLIRLVDIFHSIFSRVILKMSKKKAFHSP